MNQDNEKQFITEMFSTFIRDKALVKRFKTPDIYIMYHLSEMIEDGKMSDKTGRSICNKMFPVINQLLESLGV